MHHAQSMPLHNVNQHSAALYNTNADTLQLRGGRLQPSVEHMNPATHYNTQLLSSPSSTASSSSPSPSPFSAVNNSGLHHSPTHVTNIQHSSQQLPPHRPGSYVQHGRTNRGHQQQEGVQLFVFHLPPQLTNEVLIPLFSHFGSVLNCAIMRDPQTGQSKGFAFITMANHRDAEQAIRFLNGFNIGNKYLKVEYKIQKPKPPRGQRHAEQADRNAQATLTAAGIQYSPHDVSSSLSSLPTWQQQLNLTQQGGSATSAHQLAPSVQAHLYSTGAGSMSGNSIQPTSNSIFHSLQPQSPHSAAIQQQQQAQANQQTIDSNSVSAMIQQLQLLQLQQQQQQQQQIPQSQQSSATLPSQPASHTSSSPYSHLLGGAANASLVQQASYHHQQQQQQQQQQMLYNLSTYSPAALSLLTYSPVGSPSSNTSQHFNFQQPAVRSTYSPTASTIISPTSPVSTASTLSSTSHHMSSGSMGSMDSIISSAAPPTSSKIGGSTPPLPNLSTEAH